MIIRMLIPQLIFCLFKSLMLLDLQNLEIIINSHMLYLLKMKDYCQILMMKGIFKTHLSFLIMFRLIQESCKLQIMFSCFKICVLKNCFRFYKIGLDSIFILRQNKIINFLMEYFLMELKLITLIIRLLLNLIYFKIIIQLSFQI